MAGRGGIFDFLFQEAAHAVQDIRQKVVEEGWFGRVVTAAPVVEMEQASPADLYGKGPAIEPPKRASFEEQWAAREPGTAVESPAADREIGRDR